MNIFFSHSSDDAQIVQELVEILSDNIQPVTAFYSSNPETGVLAGQGIMDRINQEIVQCPQFVPVVTESYVRSQYCMYELSVAAFLQAQGKLHIIPIVSDQNIYNRIDAILTQFDLLYIDAGRDNAAQILLNAFPGVNKARLPQTERVMRRLADRTFSLRAYIGMSQESYEGILEYCQKYGIKQFKDTTLPSNLIAEKVKQAKEIIVLSTTGASLLRVLCERSLPEALAQGCKVSVMIPNQHSGFCKDVAQIERPDATEENAARLAQEYTAAIGYLKGAVEKAGVDGDSVICYCSHNLLRQTILLVRDGDDTVWGWVSLTMPPKKTIDGTPSFEVEGKLEEGNLVNILWQHCQGIMQVSRQRGTWFAIDSKAKGPFYLETEHAIAYWDEKYEAAKRNMDDCRGQSDCVLIEVAAQHPLKQRRYPGPEFTQRLDLAIELHKKLAQKGLESKFYVPGSRHRYRGKDDLVSLSAAGVEYLKEKGIAPELIYGEDMNRKYKADAGVYNSADECFVAASIFRDEDFEQLICVCSPNQVMRKTLFYIEFGILPQCYGVPSERMFHNVLDELFGSLKKVVYEDHSWQDPQGEAFQYYRRERMPQNEETTG